MNQNNRQKTSIGLSRRLNFPEDGLRLTWLPALLDGLAIADRAVAIAVRDKEKKEKKKLTCSKDGDVGCQQLDIPLARPRVVRHGEARTGRESANA
jgi:hypothetical protein